MLEWTQINWGGVFIPTVAPLELVLRGAVAYLGIFLLLRLVLKREAGTFNLPDLLMMVLIADAAQNAMATSYRSLPEGLLLVATIVFCNFALDWAGHRFPVIDRFTHPPPLALIEKGRLNLRNMRQEMITRAELESRLRAEGIEHIGAVKRAFLEGDGRISVITFRPGEGHEKTGKLGGGRDS